MSTLAATASPIGGTESISLVNHISAFLQTLERFNAVADKIATVSITQCSARPVDTHPMSRSILTYKQHGLSSLLFPRSGRCVPLSHNLIYELQTIIDQINRDDSVQALLSTMDEVYMFLTTAELDDIRSMKSAIERITHQTLECSYFIQAYCGNQKFS